MLVCSKNWPQKPKLAQSRSQRRLRRKLERKCVRIKLKPHALEKVRAWAHEVNARKSEAYEILKDEGVFIESAYLDEIAGDHYLIYFMKADDLSHSAKVDSSNSESLGAYHQQFKKECWESVKVLENLIDLDLSDIPLK
jgi:Family of unknown function (DUF6176)